MKKLYVIAFLLTFSILLASFYKIQASFDSTDLTIDATLNVLLDTPASYVYFNLYPNLHEEKNPYIWDISFFEDSKGWIKIEDVKIGGKEVGYEVIKNPADLFQSYSKDHALLKIFNPALSRKIEIRFTLHFPRNASSDETCWGGACIWRFGWYPVEVYKEKDGKQLGVVYTPHTCSIDMKVPKGYLFATHQGEGIGCPIGIFRGYEKFTLEGKHYIVNVYYIKGRKERAQTLAAIELDALERLSKRFGYLDYDVVNVIEAPTSGVYGMTTNGFIVLGDGVFTTADLWIPGFLNPIYEFLILHETAHLWFGIDTTVDFIYDNFLSESIAQYAAITEIEKMYGRYMNLYDRNSPDLFAASFEEMFTFKSLRENYLYIYRNLWRDGLDTTVQGKSEVVNQDFPKNYAKGYFAMRSLALYFDNFDEVLKSYHDKFKNEVVTYEKFREFLGKQKKGASKVANELFKNSGPIDAKVYSKGSKIIVEGPDFPYEILIKDHNGKTELKKISGKVEIDKTKADKVEVDPKWLLPDPDRFNNNYPTKFILPDIWHIQLQPCTENSTTEKIISPLEAYEIDAPSIQVDYTSDSSYVFLSYNFGVRKFDEWGVWLGGGSAIPVSTDVSQYSIYSASGFFAPNDFFYTDAEVRFSWNSVKSARVSLSFSIPEKANIGLSMPAVMTRNYISFLGSYDDSSFSIAGYYTYSDFIKLPVLFQLGGTYYYPTNDYVIFSEGEFIPSELVDFGYMGAYSPSASVTANFYDSEISYIAFGSFSTGLHFNVDFPRRYNFLSLASFRGLILSLEGNIEGGQTPGGLFYYYTTSMWLNAKMFLPLDTLVAAGIGVKSYFDSDFNYRGSVLYVGVNLSDYIISSLKTALSPHVHPQEPRILQLLPGF